MPGRLTAQAKGAVETSAQMKGNPMPITKCDQMMPRNTVTVRATLLVSSARRRAQGVTTSVVAQGLARHDGEVLDTRDVVHAELDPDDGVASVQTQARTPAPPPQLWLV